MTNQDYTALYGLEEQLCHLINHIDEYRACLDVHEAEAIHDQILSIHQLAVALCYQGPELVDRDWVERNTDTVDAVLDGLIDVADGMGQLDRDLGALRDEVARLSASIRDESPMP